MRLTQKAREDRGKGEEELGLIGESIVKAAMAGATSCCHWLGGYDEEEKNAIQRKLEEQGFRAYWGEPCGNRFDVSWSPRQGTRQDFRGWYDRDEKSRILPGRIKETKTMGNTSLKQLMQALEDARRDLARKEARFEKRAMEQGLDEEALLGLPCETAEQARRADRRHDANNALYAEVCGPAIQAREDARAAAVEAIRQAARGFAEDLRTPKPLRRATRELLACDPAVTETELLIWGAALAGRD
jgi:hypothetical protein